MSARETLAEMRAIEQAATEGPWHALDQGIGSEVHVGAICEQDGLCTELNAGWRDTFTGPDAEFITAARTFVPKALAALDAVLALIRARTRTPAEDGSVDEYDYVGELADDILAAIEQALS